MKHPKSILEQLMFCPCCGWVGIVDDCEPDVDGDGQLGCPKCMGVAKTVTGSDIGIYNNRVWIRN